MLTQSKAFSGFSVSDLEAAKQFYGEALGLNVQEGPMGLTLKIPGNNDIFIYQKDDHRPASFTILNFPVEDIDHAAEQLHKKGIALEKYDHMYQDEKGITRGKAENMGPDIAWFKDPAGNILSILQN